MNQLGLDVTFCLPKIVEKQYAKHVNLLTPNSLTSAATTRINELTNVTFRTINSLLQPYLRPDVYLQRIEETVNQEQQIRQPSNIECQYVNKADYGQDMYSEVYRYAAIVAELAENEDFDVIHAHDWMTYPARIAVAALSGKPLIVHVHSTEFDRSGEHVNQMIYDIERGGMHEAQRVIAVSNFTRNVIMDRYAVRADKVVAVHNGAEHNGNTPFPQSVPSKDEKLVLFLGRITMQKGPEYYLQAAKKVLEVMDDVKFVMAGSGNMMHRTIEMAAELGIGSKVRFTGFLRGDDVQKIYKMADLFVMPSVSEPFGLVPLEALHIDVPVIISNQSGVSEVLTHALKVDFWDTEEMANKIVSVLKYPALRITLRNHGNFEVRRLRWEDSAAKCAEIYEDVLVAV